MEIVFDRIMGETKYRFLVYLVVISTFHRILCVGQQGKNTFMYSQKNNIHVASRLLLKDWRIKVEVECPDVPFNLHAFYLLRYSPCANAFNGIEERSRAKEYLISPLIHQLGDYTSEFISNSTNVKCEKGKRITLSNSQNEYFSAWKDGAYGLFLQMTNIPNNLSIKAEIQLYSDHGYLSAEEYPMLILSMVLAIFNVALCLVWSVVMIRDRRELLQIQHWITACIVLRTLQLISAFSVLKIEQTSGFKSSLSALIDTCLMGLNNGVGIVLIMMISYGFYSFRHRLGKTYCVILLVAFLSSLLLTMSVIQQRLQKPEAKGLAEVALVILFLISLFIIIFVVVCMVKSIRKLKTLDERNMLFRYRCFGYTLLCTVIVMIVCVSVSVVDRMGSCWKGWKYSWMWMTAITIVSYPVWLAIMVLWRPSQNKYRYIPEKADLDSEKLIPKENKQFGIKMATMK